MARRQSSSPDAKVASFSRNDFFDRVWEYKAGEHLSLLGPTGNGKTTLAYQLLRRTATQELPGVVLVMKPRDDTADKFTRASKYRRVRSWPPRVSLWQPGRRPGYTLWPAHSFIPELDDRQHFGIFRSVLRDTYRRGGFVVFADEVAGLMDLPNPVKGGPGLDVDLNRLWMRGRSMGTGLWAATQRPAWVPLNMYQQAEHLFLSYDPDMRSRKRFEEIGGVDPDLVGSVTARLPKFSWLYVRRRDRTMCVVGP